MQPVAADEAAAASHELTSEVAVWLRVRRIIYLRSLRSGRLGHCLFFVGVVILLLFALDKPTSSPLPSLVAAPSQPPPSSTADLSLSPPPSPAPIQSPPPHYSPPQPIEPSPLPPPSIHESPPHAPYQAVSLRSWLNEPAAGPTPPARSMPAFTHVAATLRDIASRHPCDEVRCNLSSVCRAFDSEVAVLGFEGLLDAALQEVKSAHHEGRSEAADNALGGIEHLIGAWACERQHPRELMAAAARAVLAFEGEGSSLMHAAVWHAVVLTSPPNQHSLIGSVLWAQLSAGALRYLFEEDTAATVVRGRPLMLLHAAHGLGHGALLAAVLATHGGTTAAYSACHPFRVHSLHLDADKEPQIASDLCADAPSLSMAYVCASGAFMAFFELRRATNELQAEALLGTGEIGDGWAAPCVAQRFAAVCFARLVSHSVQPAFEAGHVQSAAQLEATARKCGGINHSERARRSCFFGASAVLFPFYDHLRWPRGEHRRLGGSEQRSMATSSPHTFAEWCSVAASDGEPSVSRTRFLACVGGGIYHLTFQVGAVAVATRGSTQSLVDAIDNHCSQLEGDAPEAAKLCRDGLLCTVPRTATRPHVERAQWPLCSFGAELVDQDDKS